MILLNLVMVVFVICIGRFETCKFEPLRSSPFCNITLSIDERIDYIIPFLEFDEKINLMYTPGWDIGFRKINLSPFQWTQEAIHGLAYCNLTDWKVTSFPQVTNLGSTFDMDLVRKMASAIADEGRALSNIQAIDASFWAPNINIFRDPRWGRGQETPGEDPFLTGEYAKAYISGIQFGEDPKYYKSISGCKHYTAYDLEHWNGVDRHHFDAIVSKRDLVETFNYPFKIAITEAGARQLMCSYNSVNGVPSCVNKYLLEDVLRGEWRFEGHVVSDCGAIQSEFFDHLYFQQPEKAVSESIKTGCDLDCGWWYNTYSWYAETLGELTSKDLDTNIKRLFRNRMLLGDFDPWEKQIYRKIPSSVVSCKKHQELALELARESMVLLKNEPSSWLGEKMTLPLDISVLTQIAVIGPNGNAHTTLQGDYPGPAPFIISPLDGIKKYFDNTKAARGCNINDNRTDMFQEAIDLARESDLTIIFLGLDPTLENEGRDRNYIHFPGVQEELIQKIALDSERKGDLVLVLINGGSIDISWEKESKDVGAILWAGYPSQSGGEAIADVLFGSYNPAGRTTYTIYPNDFVNQVSFFDMDMRPHPNSTTFGKTPGRSYKFYEGEVVYPFGYGLSYTSWEYSWTEETESEKIIITLKTSVDDENRNFQCKNISLMVKNTGDVNGDVVVLAYITNTFMKDAPKKKLFGFQRLHDVKPGETRILIIEISQFAVEYVNVEGERVILQGEYLVQIENLKKNVEVAS